MSLRARQVDQRRHRILDATALLIRETGGTEFSMRRLAEVAEVSPATPYNLFGSKEGLLYALLARSLDQIAAAGLAFGARDPLDRVLEAAEKAADIFIHDPDYMRPLYRYLLGVADAVHRPRFIARSLAYWREGFATDDAAGLFDADFDVDSMVYALMAHFMGVLEFWIQDDIDAEGFRQRVTYGTVLLLLPLARDTGRARLVKRLRASKRILARSNVQDFPQPDIQPAGADGPRAHGEHR